MAEKPPPYGSGTRTTQSEREARLVIVEDMLFRRLLPTGTIERTLSAEFGIKPRGVRRYIKTVRDRARLRAQADPDPRVTRETLTEAVVDLMNEARNRTRIVDGRTLLDPDLRTALRAVYALMDLHGLRVQRHEITGANGTPLAVSSDDAVRLLAEQLDKHTSRGPSASPPPASDD